MICSDTIFYRFSNAKYNRNVPINRTTAKVNKKPNSTNVEVSAKETNRAIIFFIKSIGQKILLKNILSIQR